MIKATYEEIDDLIVHAIQNERRVAAEIIAYVDACLLELRREWPYANKQDCVDRVIDRRLQSLRKRGVIRFSRVERRWVMA